LEVCKKRFIGSAVGKYFNVEETLCIAKGDATCTIDIDKEPLD
jgi:predicted hydrocarbon binding protein